MTTTEPPAIETEGLTKHYGDVVAVDELDLTVQRGEVYGFLGPNGSGKSTTMNMLTTLVRPTAGTARILGTDIGNRNEVIRHIGYLPDKLPLFEELTAREQLGYIAALNDIPREGATERAEKQLERFGLAAAADRRIGTYSRGMRQKLGVIQTLLKEPPVLLMDEPTSGLDPRAARTVKDVIAELAGDDTTILLTTHILSVVDELADTVGVIHNGGLVAEGPIGELKRRAERGDERTLEDVFLAVTADHVAEWEGTDSESDVTDSESDETEA